MLSDWDPIDDEDLDVTRKRGPAVPESGASPVVDASATEARSLCGSCCGGSRRSTEPPLPPKHQAPQPVAPSAPQQVTVCVETVSANRNRSLSTPPFTYRSNSMQPLPPPPAPQVVPGHSVAISYAAPLGSGQASRMLSVPRQPQPSPQHPPPVHPPKQATAWQRVMTPKQHRAWTPRRSPTPVHRHVTPGQNRPPSEGPPAPVSYSPWPLALLGRQQPFLQSSHGGHAHAQSQTGPSWSTTTVSHTTPRIPPVAQGLLVPPQAQPLPIGAGPGTAAGWQQQCSPLPRRQQLAVPLPGPPAHHASQTSLLLQGPPLKPTMKSNEVPVFPAVHIRH